MKEILAELYNKVVSFFLTEKSENTKDIASNRLKLVLMHDRTKLDPLTLENMRHELIDVISKYVVIDKELLELNLAGEGDSIALMLNIPVVRAKTEEELMLEAQEKAKEEEETIKEDLEDELDAALDSEDLSYEESEQEESVEEETEIIESENTEEQETAEETDDSTEESQPVEEFAEVAESVKENKKNKNK